MAVANAGHRLWLLLTLAVWSVGGYGATESSVAVTPVGATAPIPAILLRPDGDGPFPAVVVMHDCSGLGARSSGAPMRWARLLATQGYVALLPDSFSSRGFPDGVCTVPGTESRRVNGFVRAADAFGALAALRSLAYVDGHRIGVMGGSHGGWATLAAMTKALGGDAALSEAKRDGFRAAIALYPGCAARYGTWSPRRERGRTFGPSAAYAGIYEPLGPLLILIGEKDDWTPAEPCRRLAETSRAAGHPVEIKVYPDAHHAFDSDRPVRYVEQRNNASSPSGRGATTGGNPAAWADARKEVASFFDRHLRADP